MALIDIETVKAVKGIVGDTHDAMLTMTVNAITVRFENYCHRGLELASAVQDFDGGKTWIQAHRYPIVSVDALTESADRDFDGADPLVENDDYVIEQPTASREPNLGRIRHRRRRFLEGVQVVRLAYVGGYWCGAAAEAPAGSQVLPDDILEQAKLEAWHQFSNRDKFGARSISVGDMSVSEIEESLLQGTKDVLDYYRRWA